MGKAIQDLPLEDRISRRKWLLQITQVTAVSSSSIVHVNTHLPTFLSPAVVKIYMHCAFQGKGVHVAYMDVYKLARPVFNGPGPDLPACEARISSKVPSLPSHKLVQVAGGLMHTD